MSLKRIDGLPLRLRHSKRSLENKLNITEPAGVLTTKQWNRSIKLPVVDIVVDKSWTKEEKEEEEEGGDDDEEEEEEEKKEKKK
ncbi:hypothetical protein ElyMa_006414600 [Elysia marginata]|uniref:Uncharacterized protein n=1 Tax=Elysia marginata TaxID=1093978 RepID=A0AAV4HU51_9GAST|nr:hypothetical protein ElyMa_006414600 [Elysia marginata]